MTTPLQDDAASGVDRPVEGSRDEGRGLVLGDDCWAGEPGTVSEVGTPIHWHLRETLGLGIEEPAAPGFQRCLDSSDGARRKAASSAAKSRAGKDTTIS